MKAKAKPVKIAYRAYACRECGHRVSLQTNHKIDCYPVCKGACRQIINPHTARERVLPKQTAHRYVSELE